MPEVEDLQRAPAAASAGGPRQRPQRKSSVDGSPRQRQTQRTSGGNRPALTFGRSARRLYLAKLVEEAVDFPFQFVDEQIVVDFEDHMQFCQRRWKILTNIEVGQQNVVLPFQSQDYRLSRIFQRRLLS